MEMIRYEERNEKCGILYLFLKAPNGGSFQEMETTGSGFLVGKSVYSYECVVEISV